MSYIDLSLKNLEKKDENIYIIKDIIDKNRIIVILGAPGSGKSSILEKYKEENNNTELIPVKEFILFDNDISESTEVVLLDGMDEYRSFSTDKTIIVSKIGNKINKLLKIIKI